MKHLTLRPFTPRPAVLIALPVLLVFLVVSRADALYLFYMRKDLAHLLSTNPDEVVGKQVVVTDRLAVLWPDAQERPNQLKGQRYVFFDTDHFHCAVPTDRMGTHLASIWEDAQRRYQVVTEEIEEINRQQREGGMGLAQAQDALRPKVWELHRIWANQPIVTIFGTVERADFWGEVKGKSQGVATERVTIVVDRVEQPRRRWYESLDD